MTKYNINIIDITSYLETHQPSTLELSMTEEQLFVKKIPYGLEDILDMT